MPSHGNAAPSAWITRFAPAATGPVLDLACGAGRHARLFLDRGLAVTAVDREIAGLDDIAAHPHLTPIAADLEAGDAPWRPAPGVFGTVVVANYLWRPLLPALVDAIAPGGMLLYETFGRGNERFGKPSNPDFLLAPGELLDAVHGRLRVVAYEAGIIEAPRPAVVQRICAVNGAREVALG